MLLCTKPDSIPQMEILRITFTAARSIKYVLCQRSELPPACTSTWRTGRDSVRQQHISRINLVVCCLWKSECVRSHPAIHRPRGTVPALYRQGVQFRQCLLFKSHIMKVKRNLVGSFTCHWIVCICVYFNSEPSLYSVNDGRVKNKDFFFLLLFSQVH